MMAASQTGSTTRVDIDASPTDPDEAESRHAVVFTVGANAGSAGGPFNRISLDYAIEQPSADVSNVGPNSLERIGVDDGGDDVGTRIDRSATVNEIQNSRDGKKITIITNGELGLTAGDEVVVVMRPVQNPQNPGTPRVEAVLNGQGPADTARDKVTYVQNEANVTFRDQSTRGERVTVEEVTLSEGGWVAISDTSTADPGAIRGAKYLGPGTHSDVQVTLYDPVQSDTELYAQAHLDSDGDLEFDYNDTNPDTREDDLYRNADGNPQTDGSQGGSATVTKDDSSPTPTPSSPTTPTPTESASDDGAPQITNYEVTSDGDEITVAFDSDETLADIEADVRGPEDATLVREDFSGDRFSGYEATYRAGTAGDYTVELVTAEDSGGNDGAEGEDFTDSTTVESTNESTDGSTDDSSGDSTDSSGDSTDSTDDSSGDSTDDSSGDSSGDSTDDSSSDSSGSDDSGDSGDSTDSGDSGDSAGDSGDSTDDSSSDSSGSDDSGDSGDSSGSDDSGDSDDEAGEADSQTESDGPGLGPVVAVTALLAVALLFYRRR